MDGRPRYAAWSRSVSCAATMTPSTGASRVRPKPGNLSGGSGRTREPNVTGAVRPAPSTGTKSIA